MLDTLTNTADTVFGAVEGVGDKIGGVLDAINPANYQKRKIVSENEAKLGDVSKRMKGLREKIEASVNGLDTLTAEERAEWDALSAESKGYADAIAEAEKPTDWAGAMSDAMSYIGKKKELETPGMFKGNATFDGGSYFGALQHNPFASMKLGGK